MSLKELITTPSLNNTSYGYMWWLNKGNRKWPGLSENIFMQQDLEVITL